MHSALAVADMTFHSVACHGRLKATDSAIDRYALYPLENSNLCSLALHTVPENNSRNKTHLTMYLIAHRLGIAVDVDFANVSSV